MSKQIVIFTSLIGFYLCLCTVAIAVPPTHTISGFVLTGSGSGIEGINVAGNNGATSTLTGADGSYSITVSNHWDGTVTVSKTGWLITPASKTYTNVSADIPNENYTAYQPKISGFVRKSDATPLAGASVTADNGGGSGTSDAAGYYEFFVPYNWTGNVAASLAGYGFTSKPYSSVTTDITNQNFSGYQPTISGYVKKADGTAISDVSITADNVGSTTTDATGYYEIIVPYNWTGNVIANKMRYGMTPGSYSYTNLNIDQSNQNFEAIYTGIIVVKADGTGDVPTIQAAIDIAINGDIVQVEDGTYTGWGNRDIRFLGKAITVRGNVADPNLVVIDCQGSSDYRYCGFEFNNNEGTDSILEGLTVTNGYAHTSGGGIYCVASSPTIQNCIITNNTAHAFGGGLFGCGGVIQNCIINANSATARGGGLYDCDGIIRNCTITNNSSGAGGGLYGCNGTIQNCTIANNSADYNGGGLCDCNGTIINCTIVNNSANRFNNGAGGGLYGCNGTVQNCIIWGNIDYYRYDQNYNSTVPIYSCIQDWADGGIGNISDDPLFVDAANDDYHLSFDSPCINTADPDYIQDPNETDIDGEPRIVGMIIDMGIDEVYGGDSVMLSVPVKDFQFTALEAGQDPALQTLNFYNLGLIDLNWSASDDVDWLNITPTVGIINHEQTANINMDVDITNLPAGDYSGQITISDPNAVNSPKVVDVSLTITGPSLGTSQNNYSFTASKQTIDPSPQTLTISNLTGGGTLNWTITPDCNWMTIEPASGAITSGSADVLLDIDQSKINYGNHTCQLTVEAPNAANSPQTVTVTLDVLRPELTLSQNSFSFTGDTINLPQPQTLTIQNTGYDILNWTITETTPCDWLTVTPQTGQTTNQTPANTALSVNPALAGYGLHSCQLIVSDPNATNNPQTVTVTLDVLRPELNISQNSFNFVGDTINPPQPQTLTIQNTGFDILNWTITEPNSCDWLTITPQIGQTTNQTPANAALSVNPALAGYGLHTCQLTVSDLNANNSPQTVTVTLDVLRPELAISQNSFSFSTGDITTPPSPQLLTIQNTGYDTLNWTITESTPCDWLTITPPTGQTTNQTPSNAALSVDPAVAGYGLHTCQLTVSDPDANSSPQTVTVSFNVWQPVIHLSFRDYNWDLVNGVEVLATGFAEPIIVDGTYDMAVPYGWSGTITPSKPDVAFDPTAIVFENVTQQNLYADFTQTFAYSDGDGSVADPFQITDAEDLRNLADDPLNWDKHFIMINDIDMGDPNTPNMNTIAFYPWSDFGWFSGVFDGQGFSITDLNIFNGNGLFGVVDYSWQQVPTEGSVPSVKDLVLVNPTVDRGDTPYYAGSLAGIAGPDTVIENCIVENGYIRGSAGLVDTNYGTIRNCNVIDVYVEDPHHASGGMVGVIYGVIESC
ncbi:hypothetical protein KAR91_09620, partial [Candidatus Pacearchaeota archaeon]|nr:hypothetical protein [Candidatus Pacearchaeota archaeon]